MRTIVSTVVLGIALGACGGAADEQPPVVPPPPPSLAPTPPPADTPPPATAEAPPAPKPSVADAQQAMIKAYPASFADAAKIAALYAADAQLMMPGFPDVKGRDGIQAFHQSFVDANTNLKLTTSRVWIKGNALATEWVLTGTQSKEWNGIPASEKPWGFTGGTVFWFGDDGLITKEHRYFDFGTYLAQVGVSKQKVRAIPTPGGSLEMHVAKSDAAEDKNVETARGGNRVFEKHDLKGFLAMLSDDAVYDDVTMPTAMKGKAPAKAFFEGFTKAFPDLKVTESNVWGVEDFTVDEYEMTGTQKAPLVMGPGMSLPNTKKSIDTHTLEIMQWKDGKMVKGWAYANGMEFATQLGLAPKPGEKPADKGAKPAAEKPAAPKKAPAETAKAPAKK